MGLIESARATIRGLVQRARKTVVVKRTTSGKLKQPVLEITVGGPEGMRIASDADGRGGDLTLGGLRFTWSVGLVARRRRVKEDVERRPHRKREQPGVAEPVTQ